jgi:alcohol dehydrogenase (NADP+)
MRALALGADEWVLPHPPDKEADARSLDVKCFVSTKEKDWHKPQAFTFGFILNAADTTSEFDWNQYFSTLNTNG